LWTIPKLIRNFVASVHSVIMIIAGYLGAVSVVTTVKWFWFCIAISLFVPVSANFCQNTYLHNRIFWSQNSSKECNHQNSSKIGIHDELAATSFFCRCFTPSLFPSARLRCSGVVRSSMSTARWPGLLSLPGSSTRKFYSLYPLENHEYQLHQLHNASSKCCMDVQLS
jgi:hypothetical protein